MSSNLDYKLEVLEACAKDKFTAMETLLKVRPKGGGDLIPLSFSTLHRELDKYGLRTQLVLKGRQVYVTTYYLGSFFLDCIERKNVSSCFVNLDNKKTEAVFDRVHTFYDNLIPQMRPEVKTSRTGKLQFKNLGTSFEALTCQNDSGEENVKAIGRSLTATNVHISEAAFVKHLDALLEAFYGSIPKGSEANTKVILESTGNGAQGSFYNRCMEVMENGTEVAPGHYHYGQTSFHFMPWFQHDEYRQMENDPFEGLNLPHKALVMWKENEEDHRTAMKAYGYSEAEINQAVNFIRYVAVNEYKLANDPAGCIKSTNQEYPANVRMAFQSTGSAFLSLSRTDNLESKWKEYNRSSEMPIPIRMIQESENQVSIKADEKGEVMLWKPVVKGWKYRYCIGSDIGAGLPDSDPSAAFVLDRYENQVVAAVHGQYGPKKMAELLFLLGVYYDTAKLGWENNNHGYGTTILLRETNYPNLFHWRENPLHDADWGFNTNHNSRNQILQLFKQDYETLAGGLEIPYLGFYKEAKAFACPPGKDKPEGINEHDDLVMTGAITNAISHTMPPTELIKKTRILMPGTVGHTVMRYRNKTNNVSEALKN